MGGIAKGSMVGLENQAALADNITERLHVTGIQHNIHARGSKI
jgi:hypothetical protein